MKLKRRQNKSDHKILGWSIAGAVVVIAVVWGFQLSTMLATQSVGSIKESWQKAQADWDEAYELSQEVSDDLPDLDADVGAVFGDLKDQMLDKVAESRALNAVAQGMADEIQSAESAEAAQEEVAEVELPVEEEEVLEVEESAQIESTGGNLVPSAEAQEISQ